MPTATEYREAAARLRTMGENVLRRSAMVSGWTLDAHIGPGAVNDRARQGLGVVAGRLSDAAEALAQLAVTCDQRAATCDRYRARLADYLALDPAQRLLVQRPQPPYSWVQ